MPDLSKNNKRSACRGDNLDRFMQPVILDILLKEPCSGYAVVKKMGNYTTFAAGGPDPTGVYRYLRSMQKKGVIEQRACITHGSDSEANLFYITKLGQICLANWKKTLAEYAGQIEQLIEQLK